MSRFNLHHSIYKSMLKVASILIFCCCGFMNFQCTSKIETPTEILHNPVDPENPDFTYPMTTILTKFDSQNPVTSPEYHIQVQGNVVAIWFSYKLDSNDWSNWNRSTTIVLTDLDEGVHHCIIRALHQDNITVELNPPSIDFYVKAVTGPALMFSQRKKVVSRSSDFNYYIVVKDVQDLYGVKLVFTYDYNALQLEYIAPVIISNVTTQFFKMQYADKGLAEMFFTGDPAIHGITGTDTIAEINFKPLRKGESNIIFIPDSVQFRNASNAAIPVNQLVNGKVVVK